MIIIILFLIYYLQLAGTIVTYEIVLVQLNSLSIVGSNTSANMTEKCHHWNAFYSVMFTLRVITQSDKREPWIVQICNINGKI